MKIIYMLLGQSTIFQRFDLYELFLRTEKPKIYKLKSLSVRWIKFAWHSRNSTFGMVLVLFSHFSITSMFKAVSIPMSTFWWIRTTFCIQSEIQLVPKENRHQQYQSAHKLNKIKTFDQRIKLQIYILFASRK